MATRNSPSVLEPDTPTLAIGARVARLPLNLQELVVARQAPIGTPDAMDHVAPILQVVGEVNRHGITRGGTGTPLDGDISVGAQAEVSAIII